MTEPPRACCDAAAAIGKGPAAGGAAHGRAGGPTPGCLPDGGRWAGFNKKTSH